MAVRLIVHFLIQLLFTVGIIVATGLIVSLAKRGILRCSGKGAHAIEVATGLIGTPIHELSHAFFCILFCHRITAIRLWSPHASGGNLGYVTHTYKKRNLWHQIGNFFIGVAPILGGTAVLFLLMWLLLPGVADTVLASAALTPPDASGSVWEVALEQTLAILSRSWQTLCAFFQPQRFLEWHFYLYLLFAIPIVLHMEVSGSDLKLGGWGLLFLSVLLFLTDLAFLFLFPEGMEAITGAALSVGAFAGGFFLLAIAVSLFLLLLSLAVLLIRRLARRG